MNELLNSTIEYTPRVEEVVVTVQNNTNLTQYATFFALWNDADTSFATWYRSSVDVDPARFPFTGNVVLNYSPINSNLQLTAQQSFVQASRTTVLSWLNNLQLSYFNQISVTGIRTFSNQYTYTSLVFTDTSTYTYTFVNELWTSPLTYSSNLNYTQLKQSQYGYAYSVEIMSVLSENIDQALQPITFTAKDASGVQISYVTTPTISPYQYNNQIYLKPDKVIMFDGFTGVNFKMLPSELVRFVFFSQQISPTQLKNFDKFYGQEGFIDLRMNTAPNLPIKREYVDIVFPDDNNEQIVL